MMNNLFLSAQEVADVLCVSKPYAYKIIKSMNEELEARNFMTVPGKVSRKFFEEKFYGLTENCIKC